MTLKADVMHMLWLCVESPITARDIVKKLGMIRTRVSIGEVNSVLYKALDDGEVKKDDGIPPRWCQTDGREIDDVSGIVDDYGCKRTIILIDLGNVHDCLQELLERGINLQRDYEVHAFADYHFNGFGVNPKVEDKGITVHRVEDTNNKNAADVLLIWTCQNLCKSAECTTHFIVVTKDDGFRYLSKLVKDEGHDIHFVKDREGLLELIQ